MGIHTHSGYEHMLSALIWSVEQVNHGCVLISTTCKTHVTRSVGEGGGPLSRTHAHGQLNGLSATLQRRKRVEHSHTAALEHCSFSPWHLVVRYILNRPPGPTVSQLSQLMYQETMKYSFASWCTHTHICIQLCCPDKEPCKWIKHPNLTLT